MKREAPDWSSLIKKSQECLPMYRHSLDEFRRIEVMKRFATELKSAVKCHSGEREWALVGHAALLITENVDECRDLLCLIAEFAGFGYLALAPEQVIPTLGVASIPAEIGPCLIYLEPGQWMREIDSEKMDGDDEQLRLFQKHLLKIIKDFDPNHPVVFVTSAKGLKHISESFRQVGAFDRRFEYTTLSLKEEGENFLKLVGQDICDESILNHPGKVGKLIGTTFDDLRRQGLIALALKRIAAREGRNLEFNDFVHIAIHGSAEMDEAMQDEELQRLVAIHEAGHATLAIIDSDGRNIPDYLSAFPGDDYMGVVVYSYAYNYEKHDRLSYIDFRHRIRVGLAGRAAEQLVLGSAHVNVRGARSDLEKATSLCDEMFAVCGISPDMENPESAGSNLAVVVKNATPTEAARIDGMSQSYLERQYQIVLETLAEHRDLYDAIVDRLMKQRVLDQSELSDTVASVKSRRIHRAA